MFAEFIKRAIEAAAEQVKQEMIAEGRYFEEEKITLRKETISLLDEIENFNNQSTIDKALRENDKATFLQLTGDAHA